MSDAFWSDAVRLDGVGSDAVGLDETAQLKSGQISWIGIVTA
jgi:hypothetical protein